MARFKAIVEQTTSNVKGEGDPKLLASTRLGQLFTVDWKTKLLLAGRLWRVTVGAFGADSDVTQITGGGGGTTLELEKPEIAIGVGSGYFLIPVEISVSVQADQDADADYTRIVAIMDRTATVPTSVTGVIETPVNMLDGGATTPATAYSAITTDITAPTMDELLAFKTNAAYQVSGAGTIMSGLDMLYEPDVPSLGIGPCAIYVYWGGTVATTGMATVVFGVVPKTWFEV